MAHLRYNRQEILPFIRKNGQEKLGKSAVAIIGLGALGTVASELLARAGVGKLTVIDRDIVEITDLQRQLLYEESDLGKPKAAAAVDKLRKINSEIKITAAAADVDSKNIGLLVGKPDVVLDCTDNLETRFLINEYCLKNKLAWVHAAAIMERSEFMVFDFGKGKKGQPCFACAFGKSAAAETCDTSGVLGTATAIISAMQSTEAVKLIIGAAATKKLIRINSWNNSLAEIDVKKKPNCSSCGKNSNYDYLTGKKGMGIVKMCGKGVYQLKGKVDIGKLKSQLQAMDEDLLDFGECISFRNMTAFKDGRVLVKADSVEKAKADCARYFSN